MIILDTKVLSELMKPRPDPTVVAWMGGHPAASLYTTSITQAEILYALILLPRSRRRSALASMFAEDFAERIPGLCPDRFRSAPRRPSLLTFRCPDCRHRTAHGSRHRHSQHRGPGWLRCDRRRSMETLAPGLGALGGRFNGINEVTGSISVSSTNSDSKLRNRR